MKVQGSFSAEVELPQSTTNAFCKCTHFGPQGKEQRTHLEQWMTWVWEMTPLHLCSQSSLLPPSAVGTTHFVFVVCFVPSRFWWAVLPCALEEAHAKGRSPEIPQLLNNLLVPCACQSVNRYGVCLQCIWRLYNSRLENPQAKQRPIMGTQPVSCLPFQIRSEGNVSMPAQASHIALFWKVPKSQWHVLHWVTRAGASQPFGGQ